MKLFRQTIYQKSAKVAITLVLLVAFVFSLTNAQATHAQTTDSSTIFSAIKDMWNGVADTKTETNEFPVANEKNPLKKITVVITAYSSEVWQTDSTPCITANGHDLCKQYNEQGFGDTIAANFLPMGKQVKIPGLFGDKIFVVRDRMNARYGYGRIDIWMPSTEEARQFGVKRIEMEVF